MGQLIVMKDGAVVEVRPLGRTNVTVGRLEYNTVVIAHPSVSRAHVRVGWDGAGWFVEDLGSTNGTFLNDRRVEREGLSWGDRIRAGEYVLHFLPGDDDPGVGAAKVLDEFVGFAAGVLDLVEPREVLERMLDRLMAVFEAERGFVLLAGPEGLRPTISRSIDPAAEDAAISMTVAGDVARDGRPVLITDALAELRYQGSESIERGQIRSVVCVPLPGDGGPSGVLYFDSRVTSRTYGPADLALARAFAEVAARALRQAERRTELARKVQRFRRLQQDEGRRAHDATRVVAESAAMKGVLARVDDVAAADIATLILGESGTGKELVARAIHERSSRRDEPFVAVNCMVLSSEVIASELFGHEKGAFTGAVGRRLGRCELADGGTLFLDEVGELDPAVQVKLLRFLQEKTFERVGGSETLRVDVRVLAATNADIEARVADGSFREDLYYRINAFTLRLPPLRERREDVPALAAHFGAELSAAQGRSFDGFDADALRLLADYHWPGNVRELRNVVERALVLERGGRISGASLPFAVAEGPAAAGGDRLDLSSLPRDFHRAKDLFERLFIEAALRRHGGAIAAAARETGLPRKTIYRKIEAFKIRRTDLS